MLLATSSASLKTFPAEIILVEGQWIAHNEPHPTRRDTPALT